jgi:hypothetical protein
MYFSGIIGIISLTYKNYEHQHQGNEYGVNRSDN